MKVMILGATGLVGGKTLERALNNPRFSSVVAPSRKPLPAHDGLENPVSPTFDFETAAEWWSVDAIISALGTTRKAAGSAENFRAIDRDLPLLFARRAQSRGAHTCVNVSSKGADERSMFLYTRTKGQLDEELARIPFRSLTIVRPGFIEGERVETRALEGLIRGALKVLHPVLPAGLRPNAAERIADVLIQSVLEARPGKRIISSDELL